MPRWALVCLSFLSMHRRRLSGFSPPPQATVLAKDVPVLFREPYIHGGYRPVGQRWSCYLLSLFQVHNESVNVWSHMLTGVIVLLRFLLLLHTWPAPLDLTALPLCLYVTSALTYLTCSAAAHLLQSHSELAHYCLFFLDYVGVCVYQYGCALAHYFYSSEPAWRNTAVADAFLPGAVLLGWLTCASCCFAKLRYQRPYPLRRKVFQLVPTSLAYLLDISPVAHRLASAGSSDGSDADDALALHALQIFFFLLAALFFSCPVPECFFPGRCDVLGHGHQIFHLFLALCTLVQQEALFRDFRARWRTLERVHGRDRLIGACASFPTLVLCSLLTAGVMCCYAKRKLKARPKKRSSRIKN
ncbi:membrane progestin receptor beta-like [Alosa sapidissima]|uniref:membrane progestin receptor beta-like n=1 Tax=Alosa sapidissima TaxID=34773 RepID=UPI001C09630B|nr:membrane progestin receptor beta-like [Alosa sapidissima]